MHATMNRTGHQGQRQVLEGKRWKEGEYVNKLTGTSLLGAISKETRDILSRVVSCRKELEFYDEAKRLFWHAVVRSEDPGRQFGH